MAEAVTYIASTITTWAVNTLGVQAGGFISAAIAFTVNATVAYGLSYASSMIAGALGGGVDRPAQAKLPLRQPVPPRRRGYGRSRASGSYLLYEEKDGASFDVLAVHDGEIDAFEERWLHDDLVTVNVNNVVQELPDGRYHAGADASSPGGGIIRFETALGLATETANPWFVDVLGADGIWTEDHRGDGIARIELRCRSVNTDDFNWVYPLGLPQPSVVARWQKVFDPRDPAQDAYDASTWVWNENPVCHLLHYLMVERGYDYATRILPAISYWRTAADICDEDVPLKGGGFEKRYAEGGTYLIESSPATVIATMLASFDGWLGERGDGALVVYAGRFTAPTLTIGAAHIYDYTVQRFTVDEEAVNELVGKFTDPTAKWSEADAEPWVDAADQLARGKTRSNTLEFFWVHSAARVRRLLKRQMIRAAGMRLNLRTTLFGLMALGHRYIRVQNPELEATADVVCQVERMRLNLTEMSVDFELVAIDPFIDSWDPATEEGDAPTHGEDIDLAPPPLPDPIPPEDRPDRDPV